MSSYPPPPSTFGTPFNSNGHMEPPVGSRDHALPQYPYSFQNPSLMHSQGQMNGMPIVPHTHSNTHSFRSNAQGVNTLSSGNGANGAPYAIHGGQIQYSAFQNPAYPPPFAHGAPSYGPRPSNQPFTTSNLPSSSTTIFSHLNPVAGVQSTNIEDSDTVPPALSDLEDGEVDDGEAGKITGQSRASTTTPSGVSQQKRDEDIGSRHSESTHHVLNAPNNPLPGLTQGSLATTRSQNSTVSRSQRYSMTNGSVDNSNDAQFLQAAKSTSVQHHLSTENTTHESEEASQQLVYQKIEEAKQALQDLLSRGFDFSQIVNAGLNPNVLRNLYTKIEIPLTASSDLLQPRTISPGFVDVPIESAPGVATKGIHVKQPNGPQKDSNVDALFNKTSPHLVTEEVKTNSQKTTLAAKNEGKSVPSQASLAKSAKSLKSSSLNPLDKFSGIKAGEKKILDRKEYIARMLAAKAGKPAVSATIPVSSEKTTTIDSGASAQVGSSATVAATIPAAIQQAPSELVDTAPGTQKEDSDAEAKRKAQTDLARQKIEALKLRENFQQQARRATSNDVVQSSQQNAAKGVSNIPAQRSVPTPQHFPSRQSSYFSPASQKQPFSIPGLFMTSDAPEAAKPSQPLVNEGSGVSSQRVSHATFGSSHDGLLPHAIVSAQSPTVGKTSSPPDISLDSNSTLPSTTITTTTSSNRKRQKASDFIDSPSTRVKRPLGQQEDISVIIDISDDEASNDTSGDEPLDTENIAIPQDSIGRTSQFIAPDSGKERPIKNRPPLTDFPVRKRPVIMTPPTTQASGQGGDQKGLKSKEMEIEAMRRRIAELEQRSAIKGRQTTSRNHSPVTSGRVTVSPPQVESPPPVEASQHSSQNMRSSGSDSRNDDLTRLENRESFTALTETNKIAAAEEGLYAEQQLERVERAKAEVQRSVAAEISLASATDRSLTQDEKIQTSHPEDQSNLQEGEQRSKDDEQKLVQDEEERQSQEAHGKETKKIRQQKADHGCQEQEQRVAQEEPPERLQVNGRKRFLDDQLQARRSKTESGLLLLDAEVETTRTRLESLRQEIAGLEAQLQKDNQARQGLAEELKNLSRSREALPRPTDLNSCDVGDVSKQSMSAEETPAVTKPSASVEIVPDLDFIQLSSTVGNGREVQERFSPMQTSDDRPSDGEIEEDIMDISRSDVDEAELLVYSPNTVSEAQDTPNIVDDDESYEPPNEINIFQRQEPDPDAVLSYEDLQTVKADPAAETQNQQPTDQNASLIEVSTSGEPSSAASVNMAVDEQPQQSLSHSPSLANSSDPDDYEPPEPAPLGEEVPRPIRISSVDSEKSFSPPDVETHDFVAHTSSDSIPAVRQQEQKLESDRKLGHFTPYESPLKQFKSFRYHPKYLEEVSSGFRSLTYSHTINPEVPLCRYELDGVCNDDSCQNQHLRSVGLSDDKILVDLGARPDGSSPDFANGLREIIHDIRSRNIRDFNIVAGEITAYRTRFLGDSSKVLPL